MTRKDVARILDLEMAKVRGRLSDKGKKLHLSRSAKDFLVDKGFDQALGARPLRRAIENLVEDPLAEEILRGKLGGSDTVEVVAGREGLKFRQKTVREPATRVKKACK